MIRTVRAVDMFCGAGGTSTGLIQACEAMDAKVDLFAINHWQIAVESHAANHPHVNHLCTDVDQVNPKKVMGRGNIDLLVASPECTHHSIARGGKPKHEQGRASAWSVLRWVEELQPAQILIENVREFQWWSPLRKDGKRDRRYQRGCTYEAWVNSLRMLGYQVDVRILNCADYGDATTRARWFLRGTRGWKQPAWPMSTHSKEDTALKPWRTAREIIDWNLHGRSIFGRKRPLADNTLKRIEAGIRKFWGDMAEPFLIVLNGGGWQNRGRSVDLPLPTQTTANHIGLVEPFVLPHRTFKNMNADSINKPLRTVTGHSAGFSLVEPFVTIMKGQSKVRGIDEPIPTVTSNPHLYLCEPFITSVAHSKANGNYLYPLNEPLRTVTGDGSFALCEPFLVKYYGTAGARPIDKPLDAVTTRDRFGLVEGDIAALDILFRMFEPSELAAAHGFPADYEFKGTRRDQVKQIGNSVPVHTAAELCGAALSKGRVA